MRLVLSSCPPDAAERLAAALVEARLAACVSVIPQAVSRYRWQGAVVCDAESLLLCKTAADRVQALCEELQRLHPYTVPEILVLSADSAVAAYARWALEQTRPLEG